MLAAASVERAVAFGPLRGQPVARLGEPGDREDAADDVAERCHAQWDGFDLDASHVVPTGARARLERLCRYVLRPPVVSERLRLCDDGQVLWRLARPWRDGTTHVRFDPCDFLGRLAVLVPRPFVSVAAVFQEWRRPHPRTPRLDSLCSLAGGVLGARSAWRRAIVPAAAGVAREAPVATPDPPADAGTTPRRRQWAELMRRSFGFDVLACDRCGGRLRLIALIYQADVLARILTHLGVPAALPTPRPARPPPRGLIFADS